MFGKKFLISVVAVAIVAFGFGSALAAPTDLFNSNHMDVYARMAIQRAATDMDQAIDLAQEFFDIGTPAVSVEIPNTGIYPSYDVYMSLLQDGMMYYKKAAASYRLKDFKAAYENAMASDRIFRIVIERMDVD